MISSLCLMDESTKWQLDDNVTDSSVFYISKADKTTDHSYAEHEARVYRFYDR